jgi:endo-1,4-beta-mannosidase
MAANVTVSAVSQADSQQSASANLVVLAPHSIGVRPTGTIAEFFDKTTGNAFVPRGNNYIRLATLTLPNGNPFPGHSTFVVGLYDANRAESALAAMQTNGYNVARVFLEGCCQNTIGDPAGGLSSAYIANVVDFLQRARTHGIFVITTTSWLPAFGGYGPNCPEYPQFNDINLFKLCPEAVPDSVKFFHDFVQALIQKGAPLDAVFAYELDNEYTYKSSYAPLTWTSGTITTANGKTYDMGSAVSRQQMMDDGLIYFTDQMRAAILALDPTALVTVGFFVPQAPNPTRVGDPRVITVYPAMAMSTADYVSIHPYPIAGDLTFAQYAQNFGFVGYQQQKPVVLEEFGVLESNYPVESTAATVAHDWQVQSCAYGIKGWAFWTWDTSNSEQVDGPFWPASLGAGLISQTLSPAVRPDPCVN